MPKHDRISPVINGSSHRSRCADVPNLAMISMFPVSGAEQLMASGVNRQRPLSTAKKA